MTMDNLSHFEGKPLASLVMREVDFAKQKTEGVNEIKVDNSPCHLALAK